MGHAAGPRLLSSVLVLSLQLTLAGAARRTVVGLPRRSLDAVDQLRPLLGPQGAFLAVRRSCEPNGDGREDWLYAVFSKLVVDGTGTHVGVTYLSTCDAPALRVAAVSASPEYPLGTASAIWRVEVSPSTNQISVTAGVTLAECPSDDGCTPRFTTLLGGQGQVAEVEYPIEVPQRLGSWMRAQLPLFSADLAQLFPVLQRYSNPTPGLLVAAAIVWRPAGSSPARRVEGDVFLEALRALADPAASSLPEAVRSRFVFGTISGDRYPAFVSQFGLPLPASSSARRDAEAPLSPLLLHPAPIASPPTAHAVPGGTGPLPPIPAPQLVVLDPSGRRFFLDPSVREQEDMETFLANVAEGKEAACNVAPARPRSIVRGALASAFVWGAALWARAQAACTVLPVPLEGLLSAAVSSLATLAIVLLLSSRRRVRRAAEDEEDAAALAEARETEQPRDGYSDIGSRGAEEQDAWGRDEEGEGFGPPPDEGDYAFSEGEGEFEEPLSRAAALSRNGPPGRPGFSPWAGKSSAEEEIISQRGQRLRAKGGDTAAVKRTRSGHDVLAPVAEPFSSAVGPRRRSGSQPTTTGSTTVLGRGAPRGLHAQ